MGCVGPWVGGLSGSNFCLSCVGYVGQNIFYVGHNFYVGCVGKIFLRELRGPNLFCFILLFFA